MIKKLHSSNGDARLFFDDGSYIPVHITEVEQHFRESTRFTGHVLEQYKKNVALATELKAIHNSLVEGGFSEEQAIELMKCALQVAVMGGNRV